MDNPTRMLRRTLAGVVVLHACVLVWLGRPGPAHRPPPTAAPALLARWLVLPAPRKLLEPTAPPAARPAAGMPRKGAPRRLTPAAPAETPAETSAETSAKTPNAMPLATEPSAAPEPVNWADSTQRAARRSARHAGLAELSDEKIGAATLSKAGGLQAGIAAAAHGDCLKGGAGGYAGQNLGLFALPVLLVDAAGGRCAK